MNRKVDAKNMLGAIVAFPEHLETGWQLGEAFRPANGPADFDHVVISGMGGSAIGGELVGCLARPTSPIALSVNRSYSLPGYVGERTLVVATSYSGNTEETLSAFDEALERKATVMALTTGGSLATRAQARGLPYVELPGGLQPRAALGYSFGVLLNLASYLNLIELDSGGLAAAVQESRQRAADWRGNESHASKIAAQLLGKLPILYHGGDLTSAAATRWRTQLNENAKVLAFSNEIPEMNHNEVMGFEAVSPQIAKDSVVICLRDADDHPQVKRRADATRKLVGPRVGGWLDVQTEGRTSLSRMLSCVQLGDFVSYFLALEKNLDPTPVGAIEELKQILREEA